MKRLKIGILGTRGVPNHYGGFEQFAQYLSLGLVERGHDVYVYNSDQHPYKEKKWNGVQIIHCRDLEYKFGTFGQFFYDLNCNRNAAKRGFDVLLHLGYTSDSIWYWRWPKKTINMVNMDGMEWQRSKYNKPTQRFLKWAESLAAKHAQVLIADSPRIQEYLFETYGKKAVFIPYGAEVFNDIDNTVPGKYNLVPNQYFLLIARMEPENNIEMIIKGYLASEHSYPLVIVGNTSNKFGKYLSETYHHPNIHFSGPVYDQFELSNLRYFSAKYFHGHSVGGTNPSLLEAMACRCNIVAHNNVFNKAVLSSEADYFVSPEDLAALINRVEYPSLIQQRKDLNIKKIKTIYDLEKNISDYERIMFSACGEKAMVLQPAVAESA
jgi:glycosyltransferase involved in cell wall biosynthesis